MTTELPESLRLARFLTLALGVVVVTAAPTVASTVLPWLLVPTVLLGLSVVAAGLAIGSARPAVHRVKWVLFTLSGVGAALYVLLRSVPGVVHTPLGVFP